MPAERSPHRNDAILGSGWSDKDHNVTYRSDLQDASRLGPSLESRNHLSMLDKTTSTMNLYARAARDCAASAQKREEATATVKAFAQANPTLAVRLKSLVLQLQNSTDTCPSDVLWLEPTHDRRSSRDISHLRPARLHTVHIGRYPSKSWRCLDHHGHHGLLHTITRHHLYDGTGLLLLRRLAFSAALLCAQRPSTFEYARSREATWHQISRRSGHGWMQ